MEILLASDFSESAERAVDAAISLARGLGDAIVVLHVVESYDTPSDRVAERERVAAGHLEQLVTRIRREGVDARPRMAKGIPDEVICQVALQLGVRLIVVGTHGRRAPARWLLGSVAERVLASADVPVLVARDGTDALRSWSRKTHPLRLTVALESAKVDPNVVSFTQILRRNGPCEITLAHALGGRPVAPKLRSLVERELRAEAAQLGDIPMVRILDGTAPVSERLAQYLQAEVQDIVMVGVHHGIGLEGLRSGFVARHLLHAGIGAVLCVPFARDQRSTIAPFRDILVAAEWSELSLRAIACAYALLAGRGGRVTVCHVDVTPGSTDLSQDVKAALEQRLVDLLPPDAKRPDIETNVLVLPGRGIAEAIVSASVRLGVQVICIGSHGRSTVARAILGSVALEVAHRAHIPVLLVR